MRFERWSKTRMANVVVDPKAHPEAVLPDFTKADPLLTFSLVGAIALAASADLLSLFVSLETAAVGLYVLVSLATEQDADDRSQAAAFAGTPADEGWPNVSAPEPAFTSSESAWPW